MNASTFSLKELEPLLQEQYSGVNNDHLLTYAIELLSRTTIPLTFENIVVAVFRLFPECFSLIGFPEYPDAAKINRTLLHCRPKYRNLIIGNASNGYRLTSAGELTAQNVQKHFLREVDIRDRKTHKKKPDRTYTGLKIVNRIENSVLYQLWRQNRTNEIGSFEIWSFLDTAPYTDKTVLRQILRDFKDAVHMNQREDLMEFLHWIQDKYQDIFTNRGEE
jgi:hypothetical protein